MAKGEVLTPQGELVAYVHFPVTADLSNVITFSDGRATLLETAPGLAIAEVLAVTEAELDIPDRVPEMRL